MFRFVGRDLCFLFFKYSEEVIGFIGLCARWAVRQISGLLSDYLEGITEQNVQAGHHNHESEE